MSNFLDPFGHTPAICHTCKKEIGLVLPVEKACSCDPWESLRGLWTMFQPIRKTPPGQNECLSAGMGQSEPCDQVYG